MLSVQNWDHWNALSKIVWGLTIYWLSSQDLWYREKKRKAWLSGLRDFKYIHKTCNIKEELSEKLPPTVAGGQLHNSYTTMMLYQSSVKKKTLKRFMPHSCRLRCPQICSVHTDPMNSQSSKLLSKHQHMSMSRTVAIGVAAHMCFRPVAQRNTYQDLWEWLPDIFFLSISAYLFASNSRGQTKTAWKKGV